MASGMTPLYGAVVVLHVLAAVFGFGSLLATGSYARAAALTGATRASPAVRRYFRPGRNLAGLALYAVPLLGVALLALGHFKDAAVPYPWVGLFLWLVATGLATGTLWPAEKAIQEALASEEAPEGASEEAPEGEGADAALLAACRRCERAAALTSVCFVVALFFMVVQPA